MIITKDNYKAIMKTQFVPPELVAEIEALPEGETLPESERLRAEMIIVNAYYRLQIDVLMKQINNAASTL